MIDRENDIRKKEGRKEGREMIFLPELDDFYTEAFEII
jgi:hypothetical protein